MSTHDDLKDVAANLAFYRNDYHQTRRFNEDIVYHYRAHLRRLIPALQVAETADVLDVGCGMGYLEVALEGRFPHITSVDLSCAAVSVLRQKIDGARVGVADAMRLPFRDQTFDLAFTFEIIEHLPDAHAGAMEVIRVLRPGGRWVLLQHYRNDDYRHFMRMGGDALRALGLRRRPPLTLETRDVHIGARRPSGWIEFLRGLGLTVEKVIVLSILPPLYWIPGLRRRFYDLPLLTPLDHALCRLGPVARFCAMGCIYIARTVEEA